MSKLSFRARALDASKPMPIYMAEELPDLPDYSAINRAVPQMPSGMEKEEECEHHLQRAICAGLIIPTPEVTTISDVDAYDKLYPANYKQPRQLIHMQPFTMEQDIIDYDMDSDDERWLMSQTQRLDLTPLKFEEMMDKLEKSSGQTVVTINEAKALLKEDDDLIIAVFDYWLNKRLKTQHPLILHVRTEQRPGTAANNPYIAFRRRTEKMQTRKNRKNDESSYEKMLKLRRDLSRAVTLLELVKRREKIKREYVHLTIEVFEKRYQAHDFSGAMVAELNALRSSRPAFTQIFHNHYPNHSWSNKSIKDEIIPRKEKRQYKKRKHKSSNHHRMGLGLDGLALSSDDDLLPAASSEPEDVEDEGQFAFRRNKFCSYHMPQKTEGNWPWCASEENGLADKRYRYTLTSLANPRRCVGFARRRVGRGGRIIIDRISTSLDNFWRTVDFTIYDSRADDGVCEATTRTTATATSSSLVACRDGGATIGDASGADSLDNVGAVDGGGVNAVKNEVPDGVVALRTSESASFEANVKREPVDHCSASDTVSYTAEEQNEMIGFLEEVRRDWLHFRPKTPPADYDPVCNLLPADDDTFTLSANTPFSLEIQTLEAPAELLDTSVFITPPFTFEDLLPPALDVPVTDTRQKSYNHHHRHPQQQSQSLQPGDTHVQTGINLNVNVGLDTLTTSSNFNDRNTSSSNRIGDRNNSITSMGNDRTIGCSVFNVSNLGGGGGSSGSSGNANCVNVDRTSHAAAITVGASSPKVKNNVKVALDARKQHGTTGGCSPTGPSNGLLSQFGFDGEKMKNNKIQSYAYKGGVGNSSGLSSALSICTSTHPLNTLNSHSANILEIPLTDDATSLSHKVNSAEPKPAPPNNNKNKVIVQKSNLVMEVT